MCICMYVFTTMIIAIDQVTGVILMCEPVGLINQCTVMWNVSASSFVYFYLIYVLTHVNLYAHVHNSYYIYMYIQYT